LSIVSDCGDGGSRAITAAPPLLRLAAGYACARSISKSRPGFDLMLRQKFLLIEISADILQERVDTMPGAKVVLQLG
jgi:hypothetical protein